jgi:AcrR family transcriptional regulator
VVNTLATHYLLLASRIFFHLRLLPIFALTKWLNFVVKPMKADKSTEQKILEAAKLVFTEKGLDGARMQDIADKAGINKALLHYYFRSKDKLFEMIFVEEASRFMPRIIETLISDMPLFEKIEKFIDSYISLLIKNPMLPLFILNEINKNPEGLAQKLWGTGRPPIEKVQEHINKEVQNGTIKPIPAIQLMMNMVSLCIFPFLAKPIVQWISGATPAQFIQLMEQRKKEVAKFVIDSIRI